MPHGQEVQTGRIGELYAAAIIEEFGWGTAFCQQTGVDLLCWKEDKFYRCQVKASTFHAGRNGRLQFHFGLGGKKRMPTAADYDFAALISVPQRRAFFMPITSVQQYTISRQRSFFNCDSIEADSFDKTMEILNEFHRTSGRATHRA